MADQACKSVKSFGSDSRVKPKLFADLLWRRVRANGKVGKSTKS